MLKAALEKIEFVLSLCILKIDIWQGKKGKKRNSQLLRAVSLATSPFSFVHVHVLKTEFLTESGSWERPTI